MAPPMEPLHTGLLLLALPMERLPMELPLQALPMELLLVLAMAPQPMGRHHRSAVMDSARSTT